MVVGSSWVHVQCMMQQNSLWGHSFQSRSQWSRSLNRCHGRSEHNFPFSHYQKVAAASMRNCWEFVWTPECCLFYVLLVLEGKQNVSVKKFLCDSWCSSSSGGNIPMMVHFFCWHSSFSNLRTTDSLTRTWVCVYCNIHTEVVTNKSNSLCHDCLIIVCQ